MPKARSRTESEHKKMEEVKKMLKTEKKNEQEGERDAASDTITASPSVSLRCIHAATLSWTLNG